LPDRERLLHEWATTACPTMRNSRVRSRGNEFLQVRKTSGGWRGLFWRLEDLATALA